MSKHTILFLAANPLGTSLLALDKEARAIQAELERSGHRDRFELVTRWAVQPLDLLRELRKLKPTIVHFSGHGSRGALGPGCAGQGRDIVDEFGIGLTFEGADGRPQLVSTAALQETFGAAGDSVKLVVLSACYSDVQAAALGVHADAVVGMTGSIGDAAARAFAVGFYGGLGEGESVAAAYRQGCAAVSLKAMPDGRMPQLTVREGIDAERLVVADLAGSIEPLLFRLLRSGRFWVGAALVLSGASAALNIVRRIDASIDQRAESLSAKVVSWIDCTGVDAGSLICSYRGTLRWEDGRPAQGIAVELLGAECMCITSEFGGFDFGSCDLNRTRRLLHPRIFLHLTGIARCKEIPLQLPPLMTEVRLDLATCGEKVGVRVMGQRLERQQNDVQSVTTVIGGSTPPKAIPLVAATAVSKLSGEIPAISANVTDAYADVVAKLCIDERGQVTSVKIIKASPKIADELQRHFRAWRYRPYRNPATEQVSPVCFAVTERVRFAAPGVMFER